MKLVHFLLCICLTIHCTSYAQIDSIFANSPVFKGEYFSNNWPKFEPEIFAEGLLNPKTHHYHSTPVFSSNKDEMYFSTYVNNENPQRIFISIKLDGIWGKPQLAPFSGQYQDGNPVFSPDDNTLFFYSKRPINGENEESGNARIWFVNREGSTWSQPQLIKLDDSLGIGFYPSHYSNDGRFYFAIKTASRDYEIYQCEIQNRQPYNIKRLNEPISIKGKIENGAVTNPGNTILVFAAYDRNDQKQMLLYSCQKLKSGEWSAPEPMPEIINQGGARFPSFTVDGKYFFFVSDRRGFEEIYWMDASIIKNLID